MSYRTPRIVPRLCMKRGGQFKRECAVYAKANPPRRYPHRQVARTMAKYRLESFLEAL